MTTKERKEFIQYRFYTRISVIVCFVDNLMINKYGHLYECLTMASPFLRAWQDMSYTFKVRLYHKFRLGYKLTVVRLLYVKTGIQTGQKKHGRSPRLMCKSKNHF